jgi:glycosyltransferase involved in cell wall biosynthesis
MILRSGLSHSPTDDWVGSSLALEQVICKDPIGPQMPSGFVSSVQSCGSSIDDLVSSDDLYCEGSPLTSSLGPLDFTVAIRVYNPGQRLMEILEQLRNQVGVDDRAWEILVVDNNSSDGTREQVAAIQAEWDRPWPLRYCLETRQGAIFARQRAIRDARGHWIGFLDDDNFPAADWVAESIAFGADHPLAGAYSSRISGDFECEPPPRFERIMQFLPVIERDEVICFTQGRYSRRLVLPPGAGLVVRRSAWLATVPETLRLSGPVGQSLVAKGEDLEGLSYVKQGGWEIWFNPKMQISHRILAHRLERAYLMPFFEGIGLGRHWTRMLGYHPRLRPLMTLAYALNDGVKLLRHGLQYGGLRWIIGRPDLVADCEWQLLVSSLLSPISTVRLSQFSREEPLPTPQAARSAVDPTRALLADRPLDPLD